MEPSTVNIVMIIVLVVISMVGLATLVLVARLFNMHNVRNKDGGYAWMVPSNWIDAQTAIMESQERIVGAIAEIAVINKQSVQLSKSLTDAVLGMRQELNDIKKG